MSGKYIKHSKAQKNKSTISISFMLCFILIINETFNSIEEAS